MPGSWAPCLPDSPNGASNITWLHNSGFTDRQGKTISAGTVHGVSDDLVDSRQAWPLGIEDVMPALILPAEIQAAADRVHSQHTILPSRWLERWSPLKVSFDEAAALFQTAAGLGDVCTQERLESQEEPAGCTQERLESMKKPSKDLLQVQRLKILSVGVSLSELDRQIELHKEYTENELRQQAKQAKKTVDNRKKKARQKATKKANAKGNRQKHMHSTGAGAGTGTRRS